MSTTKKNESLQCGLSVVIPCYNEVDNIYELHRRVTQVCRRQVDGDYEIVFVNDGSTDNTWAELVALHRKDAHLVAVNLSRNHGHQLALSAGLSLCVGRRVLILDADLQDPPELLPDMMAAMDAGADVVYGQRSERLSETLFKRVSANLFYKILSRIVDVSIPVDSGDFRLINRRALDILLEMPEQHRFIRGMVSWIGLNQVPILYQRQPRHSGETKYTFSKMLKFAIDAVTAFSILPLRIASYFGVVFGVGGFAMLIFTIQRWITNNTVPGWTSLMVVVLLLGTAQLLVLGIVGEYLGRLYMESKRRPLFLVESVLRKSADVNPPRDGDANYSGQRRYGSGREEADRQAP